MFYFTGGKTPSDSLKYNTGKKKCAAPLTEVFKTRYLKSPPFPSIRSSQDKVFMTEAEAEHIPQGDAEMFKGSLGHGGSNV